MNPLLARYLPYVIVVLALVGLGWWGGWHFGAGHYKTALQALQASDWQTQATREATARKAVEGQLSTLKTNLDHNQQVTHDLQAQNAAIAADRDRTRDLVQRLLAEAARSTPGRDLMPESPGGQAPPRASGASGDAKLEGLLVSAAEECERNANRLDALSSEVRPQS